MLNSILSVAAAAIVLFFWVNDFLKWKGGKPFERALPGATGASWKLVRLSILVSLGIAAVQILGEYALGIKGTAEPIQAYLLLPLLGAGIVEELIFRGYLVIEKKGRKTLIVSIIFFSFASALLHGHLLAKVDYGFRLTLAPAAMWWTLILVINSLWWYAVRFLPVNKDKSLLPCFAGHMASTLAIFLVRAAQGCVTF
jgi:membrane protease YdiL (CAAX protease family)